MANLTIKKIDERVLQRLREQARKHEVSLNAYVRQLLSRSVGLESGVPAFDDLADLAGCWSQEDLAEFEESTRPFREIDRNLWD